MAEHDEGLERTEEPSDLHRQRAREQGQFAFSTELANSLLLLSGTALVTWGSDTLVNGLHSMLRERLEYLPVEMNSHEASDLMQQLAGRGLWIVSGLCGGMFVVGLLANLAQVGFYVNTESLGPKWEKLDPVAGWQRVMSVAGIVRGFWAIARVIAISTVVWWVLHGADGVILALPSGTLSEGVSATWHLASRMIVAVAGSLAVLGVGDYAVQWWRNEKSLKVSKQEQKDEQKNEEGDPLIRGQRRQRAREIAAQRRAITEVSKATVVVMNPTHFAVALRYERGVMSAPIVVAKGRDSFALQIAAKARRHGIPVVERKPLARALYKVAKVGHEIPQAMFLAVSEVLAYVYRLKGTAA